MRSELLCDFSPLNQPLFSIPSGDSLLGRSPEAEGGNEPVGEGKEAFKVLIVDDERLLADTTSMILSKAGFVTRKAYNGWEALEIVSEFRPHYLLTDVLMPIMNGVDLAIAVSKMLPATRILLISGQAGVSSILEEGKAKGYEFPLLAKPAHPFKLIERLRSLGSRRA